MSSNPLNKNKVKKKPVESCEKQEIPQAFRGRVTQKQKNPKPWTLGSRTLPKRGTRTWDAPFLPAKNLHQIRTVFCVSSMKDNSAGFVSSILTRITPFSCREEVGKEKSEPSSLMSASQRNIFSTMHLQKQSRDQLKPTLIASSFSSF